MEENSNAEILSEEIDNITSPRTEREETEKPKEKKGKYTVRLIILLILIAGFAYCSFSAIEELKNVKSDRLNVLTVYLERNRLEEEMEELRQSLEPKEDPGAQDNGEGEATVSSVFAKVYRVQDENSTSMYLLSSGDVVNVLYGDETWVKVSVPEKESGYMLRADLIQGRYKLDIESYAVDLRRAMNDPVVELVYSSSLNACKHMLLPNIPMLEPKTAECLARAEAKFNADGYQIKILEAYSPMSAQMAIWSNIGDDEYMDDPNDGPNAHTKGKAVDITLVDMETGAELEMPTELYTFEDESKRICTGIWTEKARDNVTYMTQIMTEAGFEYHQNNWWHFEYTGEGGVMPEEIDYYTLALVSE